MIYIVSEEEVRSSAEITQYSYRAESSILLPSVIFTDYSFDL